MPVIQPELAEPNKTPPVLRLGFRPFFFLAGVFATFLVAIWLLSFFYGYSPSPQYSSTLWHAHEMVFGFASAVIAGFLLTAVKNWTGIQTLKGFWLSELVGLWLAARLLPFVDIHPLFSAMISIAFFPFLAMAIGKPLIKSSNKANWLFIPIVLAIGTGDLLFQLSMLGLTDIPAMFGIYLSLHIMIILIVLMGNRVIPFFISRSANIEIQAPSLGMEILTHTSLLLWLLFSILIDAGELVSALFAGLASVFLIYRLKHWYVNKLWSTPMLWILYLGYAWVAIGLFLQAINPFIYIPPSLSIHALAVGAIGSITLGMMSRVSLGHTGRNIHHTKLLLLAFMLITITPVIRAVLPIIIPESYAELIFFSGFTWIFSFTFFTVIYAPILWQARIDGKDG